MTDQLLPPSYIPPPGSVKIGPVPSSPSGSQGGISAKLMSLDVPGVVVVFSTSRFFSPPSRSQRQGGARWNEPGVAQASPQFLEYQQTNPDVWTLHVCMDAYTHPGGSRNDLEAELATLFQLKDRVPGKKRAHKCLYTQGKQRFRCVVEDIQVPIETVSMTGGAMQAYDATIILREIRR